MRIEEKVISFFEMEDDDDDDDEMRNDFSKNAQLKKDAKY